MDQADWIIERDVQRARLQQIKSEPDTVVRGGRTRDNTVDRDRRAALCQSLIDAADRRAKRAASV